MKPSKKSQISNLKSEIPNLKSQISDPRSPTQSLKSQIPDPRSPIQRLKSQIPNLKSQSAPPPEGWRWVRLGDVCHVQLGKMLSPKSKTGLRPLPYLRNENVQWNAFNLQDIAWMDFTAAEEAKFLLRPGDLLVCEGGEPGRAAVWQGSIERCCYQKALHRIRSRGDLVHPAYLMYQLWLSALNGEFAGSQTKTTIAHLPREKLLRIDIPLPPLAEQHRIAVVLREQMAAVDKARTAAQARLEAVKALPAAFIREARQIGHKHHHTLGDCLIEVRNGVGADWSKYPVLGATREGLAPAKEGVGKAPERYKLVDPTTVFYNPMRILLGSIALVDDGDVAGITSPDYVVVKGRPGVLHTRWFYHWFRSSQGAHLIESLSRGAVRERILFNRLAAGKVEIPDYEIQARTAEQMKRVKPIMESITKELEAINALPASLLRRAFNGEL